MPPQSDFTEAKENLENALENFASNYTQEEKKAPEDKLNEINSALDSISKAEQAEALISKLPDTVGPDDTDDEKLINQAKEQHDALTDYENSLIDCRRTSMSNERLLIS